MTIVVTPFLYRPRRASVFTDHAARTFFVRNSFPRIDKNMRAVLRAGVYKWYDGKNFITEEIFMRFPQKGAAMTYDEKLAALRDALDTCDAAVIGAGAGLSASAGFQYDGENFEKHFGDFAREYGFSDMYSGGFYPFPTQEEFWGYWSRFIYVNRYEDAPRPVYDRLLALVKDRDYFVITTNVDHCFQKAGFDKQRLFYTQGDYGLFQCSEPCHDKTYDNEEIVRRMLAEQQGRAIPTELIPRCPRCGKPMTMNLRSDDRFVEDEGWHLAAGRYERFLQEHDGRRLLFLELGVGYNTPGIIKYPFWRMTAQNPNATYACINRREGRVPPQIADRALAFGGDIGRILNAI